MLRSILMTMTMTMKLLLLYKIYKTAQVGIKTSTRISEIINITDTIMQGTVLGSLLCTSTIDKLGKKFYKMPKNLYQHKGVPISPLGMIDVIISVTNVG